MSSEYDETKGIRTNAFCPVPDAWLVKQISLEEAEAKHQHEGVPFGDLNNEWKFLKAMKAHHGGVFWEFRSPPKSWQQMFGRAGIALVTKGQEHGLGLVLMMN